MSGQADNAPPHVIVFGNEKGGSGKSTTAMHVTCALLRDGFAVGALDMDVRQRSLGRYLENRQIYMDRHGVDLTMPELLSVPAEAIDAASSADATGEAAFWSALIDAARGRLDYLVVDCPGSDTPLSRLAHAHADTLVTPLNDSFIDFDLLARIDPETYAVRTPSLYSERVWEARKQRAMRREGLLDWIVMRNRLSVLDARNKRRVGEALNVLAKRIGFRLAPGFSERVIFRELFPNGLTLLDLRESGVEQTMTMSHVAARQEVRELMSALNLGASPAMHALDIA